MKKIIAFILAFIMILCVFPVSSIAANSYIEISNGTLCDLQLNGDCYIFCEFEAFEHSRLADGGFDKIFVEERKGLSWQEISVKDTGNTYEDTPDHTLHYFFFKTEPHGEKIRVRFEKGALVNEDSGKVNNTFDYDYVYKNTEFKVTVSANTLPEANKMPENTFILGETLYIYLTTTIGPYTVVDTVTGSEIQLIGNRCFIPETAGQKEYELVCGGGLMRVPFSVNIMEEDEYFAESEKRIQRLEELKKEHSGERLSYIRNALKEASLLYFGFMMAVPVLFLTVPASPFIIAVLTYIIGTSYWEDDLVELL